LLCAVAGSSWAAVKGPDVLVRETAEHVLEIIRADPDIAAGHSKRVADIVETYLLGHFDFTRMTRLAVGKNWRRVEDAQKPHLVREFRTLLVRTYSVALAQYRDQKIEYKPLTLEPGARRAVVRTAVTQPDGKPVSIDYRMARSEAGWKVYDVVVEGVSLVINYRALFNSTVESSGVDGLIALLRKKNGTAE
jgi:phospholipid transport system substrate-binding protein